MGGKAKGKKVDGGRATGWPAAGGQLAGSWRPGGGLSGDLGEEKMVGCGGHRAEEATEPAPAQDPGPLYFSESRHRAG